MEKTLFWVYLLVLASMFATRCESQSIIDKLDDLKSQCGEKEGEK